MKAGPTALAAALVLRSLLAHGCSSKILERVSLVYRNDVGVDARTLSRVRRTDQRKGGMFSAPVSAEFSEKQSRAFASASAELMADRGSEVSTEGTRNSVASESFTPRSSSPTSADRVSISRPLAFHSADTWIGPRPGGSHAQDRRYRSKSHRQCRRLQRLRNLAAAAGKRFVADVVLYDGENSAGFGDSLCAAPVRRLREAG